MKPARKAQPEFEFQKALAQYLAMKWPKALFLSDARAGTKLTIPQQARLASIQKKGFKCPDLMIFEKRHGKGGLFLELKATTPFKKDGSLRSDPHLEAQAETLADLIYRGYYAVFMWDWHETTQLIDWYLGGE